MSHPAEQFFSELYARQVGVLELRTFDHAQANKLRDFVEVREGVFDFTKIKRFLQETERLQLGAFFGVALRTQASLKTHKGDAAHCQTLTTLFVDADFKLLGEDETRSRIAKFPIPPSMIVCSGGGLHPYWLLEHPVFLQVSGGLTKAKQYLQGLARSIADIVDEPASEPVRVLRIPGSYNFKKQYGEPRRVALESEMTLVRRYIFDTFTPFLQQSSAKEPAAGFVMPETIHEGERTEHLYKLLRSQKARGISLEAAVATCQIENREKGSPPMDARELDQYLRRVWNQPDSPEFKQRKKKPNGQDDNPLDIEPQDDHFDYTTQKKIKASSQRSIRGALTQLGVTLKKDVFADRIYVTYKAQTSILTDALSNKIRFDIEEQCHFEPPAVKFNDLLGVIADENGYHPVRQYLAGLKWDGTPRIRSWLVKTAGADPSEYVEEVSRLFLIAAVRRIMQPGCKFDELLVLESSKQGINKSLALRALAVKDEWFSDDLPLNVDAKQLIERTAGKWIIEASELSGMHRSQTEHLKSMLSRQVDGPTRMAYGRIPVEKPRQFVMAGTTNDKTYLNDSTGNRRYWPVAVDKFDIDLIKALRDHWWAEAVAYEARGDTIRLDPAFYDIAAQHQEEREAQDPWEGPIAKSFIDVEQPRATPSELWNIVGVLVGQRTHADQQRINKIMAKLGFRSSIVRDKDNDNKPVRGWAKGETIQPGPKSSMVDIDRES